MAQMVKNPPAMWETWVRSLGWEDALEEGKVTDSSVLAWRIPMDRGAWWAAVHGAAKSRAQLSDEAQHSSREPLGLEGSPCSQKVTAVSQVPPSLHMLGGLHLSPVVCGSRIETEGDREKERGEATGPDDSRFPLSSPGTSGPTFLLEAASVKAEATGQSV